MNLPFILNRPIVQPMSAPEYCSIEHLAEVFRMAKEEIVDEWRTQVSDLLAGLHLDQPTMTDHMPEVIVEITRDLALSREDAPAQEQGKGSPPAHGVQRFYDGLDVGEVVAEYNLLRMAFTTVAERHGCYIVSEATRIINHRIDEAVRMAVMAFAARQALIRKEQQEEHLAFVAHDLRTPLNAISLICSEIQETLPDETRKITGGLFDILTRNLQQLDRLIKKVLHNNLPPAGAGSSFTPERRIFELWPLVQRLILDMRLVADKHAIKMVNEIPRALTVFADAGLISQVFQNLLENAFKYAASGHVEVRAESAADGVTCVVQDSGAGIPLEFLSRVFEKQTTDPGKDGTGLGLAIVRQIVEAHGGTVSVESVQGKGATFKFTIPKMSEA